MALNLPWLGLAASSRELLEKRLKTESCKMLCSARSRPPRPSQARPYASGGSVATAVGAMAVGATCRMPPGPLLLYPLSQAWFGAMSKDKGNPTKELQKDKQDRPTPPAGQHTNLRSATLHHRPSFPFPPPRQSRASFTIVFLTVSCYPTAAVPCHLATVFYDVLRTNRCGKHRRFLVFIASELRQRGPPRRTYHRLRLFCAQD